mmetsp:Transcript_11251/g.17186  ORF Transcript_11251/g.17186 Transcript_11251/m.17186 type:complete len:84 (-) Transcript_11251:1523-1774(-)
MIRTVIVPPDTTSTTDIDVKMRRRFNQRQGNKRRCIGGGGGDGSGSIGGLGAKNLRARGVNWWIIVLITNPAPAEYTCRRNTA